MKLKMTTTGQVDPIDSSESNSSKLYKLKKKMKKSFTTMKTQIE